MNVNTYDATPLHEEIIAPFKGRAFDDGVGEPGRWVEIEPDKFWPAMRYESLADVKDYAKRFPGEFVTFAEIETIGRSVTDVTHLYYF